MKVLILEDNVQRIKKFRQNLIGHLVTITDIPKKAIEFLEQVDFDYLLLDHDMGEIFESPGEGTGYEVAEWIAKHPDRKPKIILVHSLNGPGAKAMIDVLGSAGIYAKHIPFLWEKLT